MLRLTFERPSRGLVLRFQAARQIASAAQREEQWTKSAVQSPLKTSPLTRKHIAPPIAEKQSSVSRRAPVAILDDPVGKSSPDHGSGLSGPVYAKSKRRKLDFSSQAGYTELEEELCSLFRDKNWWRKPGRIFAILRTNRIRFSLLSLSVSNLIKRLPNSMEQISPNIQSALSAATHLPLMETDDQAIGFLCTLAVKLRKGDLLRALVTDFLQPKGFLKADLPPDVFTRLLWASSQLDVSKMRHFTEDLFTLGLKLTKPWSGLDYSMAIQATTTYLSRNRSASPASRAFLHEICTRASERLNAFTVSQISHALFPVADGFHNAAFFRAVAAELNTRPPLDLIQPEVIWSLVLSASRSKSSELMKLMEMIASTLLSTPSTVILKKLSTIELSFLLSGFMQNPDLLESPVLNLLALEISSRTPELSILEVTRIFASLSFCVGRSVSNFTLSKEVSDVSQKLAERLAKEKNLELSPKEVSLLIVALARLDCAVTHPDLIRRLMTLIPKDDSDMSWETVASMGWALAKTGLISEHREWLSKMFAVVPLHAQHSNVIDRGMISLHSLASSQEPAQNAIAASLLNSCLDWYTKNIFLCRYSDSMVTLRLFAELLSNGLLDCLPFDSVAMIQTRLASLVKIFQQHLRYEPVQASGGTGKSVMLKDALINIALMMSHLGMDDGGVLETLTSELRLKTHHFTLTDRIDVFWAVLVKKTIDSNLMLHDICFGTLAEFATDEAFDNLSVLHKRRLLELRLHYKLPVAEKHRPLLKRNISSTVNHSLIQAAKQLDVPFEGNHCISESLITADLALVTHNIAVMLIPGSWLSWSTHQLIGSGAIQLKSLVASGWTPIFIPVSLWSEQTDKPAYLNSLVAQAVQEMF